MQHRHIPEAVDHSLQDVCGNEKPFGGCSVVFGGDFQQILPVIVKGSRSQIIGACLQESNLWHILKILPLKINMRLGQDQTERDFAQWQLEVGHGKHTNTDGDITLLDEFKCPQNTLDSLIDTIYPGISDDSLPLDQYFANCCILSARNEDVHSINAQVLDKFPGEERIYQSADGVVSENDNDISSMYPVEFLNSINASGLPLAKLKLKIGCPVIVLRNLNPAQGVCNGTRGVVTRMANRIVEICLLEGDFAGETVFIPRITLSPSDTQIGFEFNRRQHPLCLAFTISINKAQGQLMKNVGLDFRNPVFSHGQFYVAISRATSIHRVKAIWNPQSQLPVVKNIVYQQVLL